MTAPLRRVALILCLVVVSGAVGYWLIGQAFGYDWPFFDCFYMTAITVSTVGYGEVFDISECTFARGFTIGLVFVGYGLVVYCFGTVTAFLVEARLANVFMRRRMQSRINHLVGHLIICGAGQTGIYVIRELLLTGRQFVVIERDPERIAALVELGVELYCDGDAEDNETLLSAGIERASGMVTSLHHDKDNVIVTISARQLNPRLRIVAKCIAPETAAKLRQAGADAIVSPNVIGGLRMASQLVRPSVVGFLDRMMQHTDEVVRVEEVVLREGGELAGRTIGDSRIFERTGMLVMAIQQADGRNIYNPGRGARLSVTDVLIVVGTPAQVAKLEALCRAAAS